MVMLSKNARLRYSLDNQEVDANIEWEDTAFKANFENGSVQPNLEIDKITFANREAQIIRSHIDSGNIFKGLPFKIDAYNIDTSKSAFDGFVNCSKNIEEFDDGTVSVKVQLAKGLNTLNDDLQGLTLSYLYNKGVIKDSDFTTVDYVVEKNDNTLDILFSLLTIFILAVQLRQQIKDTGKDIATAAGIFAAGFTGSVGSAIFAIAVAFLQIAYTFFMIAAIIALGFKLAALLLPPVRQHKTLKYRTALEKISTYLGYTFVSPIPELNTYHYLPSNRYIDDINLLTGIIDFPKGTKTGIPNEGDYGYLAIEFFDICKRMFEAKIVVIGNELHLRADNDTFFTQSASYVMLNHLRPVKRYNTDEFVFSKLIRFDTDEIADEWTLKNFRGTNYEVITDDESINTNEKYLSKHETINIPLALGNVKSELNGLENVISVLLSSIDTTISFFGGNSNLAGLINSKIGVLKVGTNNTTKPKVLVLNSAGRLPLNHRELLSAKYLYHNYISAKSFVLNNFRGQKAIYQIEDLPFGFNDFLKTIENSNFTDDNGELSKFRYINWIIAGDEAEIEMETHEVYAPNLKETYIEAE